MFALRSAIGRAVASASARAAVSPSTLCAARPAAAAACALRSPAVAALPSLSSSSSARSYSSSSATSFKMKKQKEWRTRAGRGFAALKTHAGCKKRFRFVSRFAVLCKHSGKHHKNFHKHHTRLARLRKMKVVPRHLVKRLKVLMPYWRNQMRKEQQLTVLATEPSVTQASDVSFQRQKSFILAQQARLREQLLRPKPYFPKADAASSA